MKLQRNLRAGFTLIEMLLVVVIIGMLVAMVGVSVAKHSGTAKIGTAAAQISNYKTALSTYQLDSGVFPTTDQGLQALVSPPTSAPVPMKWNGPYLDPAVVRPDPWGRAFIYQHPPQNNPDPEGFDLFSVGPDGIPGTADDVVSWR